MFNFKNKHKYKVNDIVCYKESSDHIGVYKIKRIDYIHYTEEHYDKVYFLKLLHSNDGNNVHHVSIDLFEANSEFVPEDQLELIRILYA